MSNLVNHSRFVKQEDHPDVEYLKQDEIGLVISKGLGELYVTKPTNPLHYLGNWLLNHAAVLKKEEAEKTRAQRKSELIEKHAQAMLDQENLKKEQEEKAQTAQQQEEDFKSTIANSLDVDDLLPSLADHLKQKTQATACYIGILEKVKKPVTDADDENAHLDPEAPEVIRYIIATPGHEFMVNKVLKEEEGEITYSVFKEEEQADEEAPEEPQPQKLKTAFVSDVVNEPRIKFFDVPKLGSYMALPLVYRSCLEETAFDTGLEDLLECKRLRAEQEEEKEKIESMKEQGEEIPEELAEKEFNEIKESEYKKTPIKLVVCLDTMGQDREFTAQEKEHAENWVNFFKEEWERAEVQSLEKDIYTHLEVSEKEQNLQTEKESEWTEEEKTAQDEALKEVDPGLSDEAKSIHTLKALLEVYRKRLLQEEILTSLLDFKKVKAIKFVKVFQIAFYYFGVTKERVVEPGTNKIHWKTAKNCLNEGFELYIKYLDPCGEKPPVPPVYAKTKRLEEELSKITPEDLQSYSPALFLLYKFLDTCFKLRISDVTLRRKEYQAKVEEREAAIKAQEELQEKRNTALTEAKEAHERQLEELGEEDSKPEFEEAKFLEEFDERESNAPVTIPEEVVVENDGDLSWEDTAPSND